MGFYRWFCRETTCLLIIWCSLALKVLLCESVLDLWSVFLCKDQPYCAQTSVSELQPRESIAVAAIAPSCLQIREDAAAKFGQWSSRALPEPLPVGLCVWITSGERIMSEALGWMQCHHLGVEVHPSGSGCVPLGLAGLQSRWPCTATWQRWPVDRAVCEYFLISSRHNQVAYRRSMICVVLY